eukprot:gene27355-biopygen10124
MVIERLVTHRFHDNSAQFLDKGVRELESKLPIPRKARAVRAPTLQS